MAPTPWSSLDGVGFSKKHDAPHPSHLPLLSRSLWSGFRRKRLFIGVIVLLGLYVFVKNIPKDVSPVGQRYNPTYGSLAPGHVLANAPVGRGKDAGVKHTPGQQYDGSVMFQNLASSLRPHLSMSNNNNVLFALPDLRTTSNLIPVACQMSQNNRSSVHVALLGRQDVEIKHLLKLNGVSAEDCPIIWHDARPDHALDSSDGRIEASIRAGFGHCCVALRPQLAILEGTISDDATVDRLLRDVATETNIPLIALPSDVLQSSPWVLALDSVSLRKLQEVEIDIVIQAFSDSAGSLIRLLRSIEGANYNGLHFPRLTIELPTSIDPFLTDFLANFRWPPGSTSSQSQLTLRHRVRSKQLSPAEASIRTIESFYPKTPTNSHVLLLAPNTELSPSYMHYLMFVLLEYKYGQDHQDLSDSLFGVSLEMPKGKLDGQASFVDKKLSKREPFIMVQAPNSNAALILGDKWKSLHAFLTHRLRHDPTLAEKTKVSRSVSEDYPSWLAEALNLMHAKDQYMIYPNFATKPDLKLVTLHQESQQPPEEHATAESSRKGTNTVDVDRIMQNDVLTDKFQQDSKKEKPVPANLGLPLDQLLSSGKKGSSQTLPFLKDIPLFSYTGKSTDRVSARSAAILFTDEFALQHGGCESLDSRQESNRDSVDYMFCDLG